MSSDRERFNADLALDFDAVAEGLRLLGKTDHVTPEGVEKWRRDCIESLDAIRGATEYLLGNASDPIMRGAKAVHYAPGACVSCGGTRNTPRNGCGDTFHPEDAIDAPDPTPESAVCDRIATEDNGTVDDAVLAATSVHIEDLGDRIWIGVYRADGDRFAFEVVPGLVECTGADGDMAVVQCLQLEGSVGSLNTGTGHKEA